MLEDELIKDAKEWIDSYYKKNCKYKKDDYNIFYTLDVQRKEVLHCRVLYDLLNKEGNHHQEDLFLKKFYEIVLNREYDNKSITVEREFYLDKENRFDLFLIEKYNHQEIKIPIEVKIDAVEGNNQLQRYADLCNGNVYFLTLEKRDPVSIENKKMVKYITFEEHIRKWLDECIEECTSEKVKNIKNILIQYKQVVDELTEQKEKFLSKKLEETNNDNYLSIIEEYKNKKDLGDIQKTLLTAYQYMKLEKARPFLKFKNRVFKEIVEHIQSKSMPYETIDVDSYLSDTDYYFLHPTSQKRYPSVVFKFMENQEGNQCIAFSLDIAVYACICLKFYKKLDNEWVSCVIDKNKLDAEFKFVIDKVKKINEIHEFKKNSEYFFWERTKYDDDKYDNGINFHELQSTYENINESKGNEILKAIKEHLDEFIERLSYAQSLLNK